MKSKPCANANADNPVRSYVQAMQQPANTGFFNRGCIAEVRTFPSFRVAVHTLITSCISFSEEEPSYLLL